MIYADISNTQSICNQYTNDMQLYAIAIRKSIRIHSHVYAIHIRNSQYANAQNVNTHDTQIPFSIRISTHPYAVGSLLMTPGTGPTPRAVTVRPGPAAGPGAGHAAGRSTEHCRDATARLLTQPASPPRTRDCESESRADSDPPPGDWPRAAAPRSRGP